MAVQHRHRHAHGGSGGKRPGSPSLFHRFVVFVLRVTAIVVVAPFVIAIILVLSMLLPGHATGRILADLFSRLADKLLWPNSQEITITRKRRR